MNVIRFKILIPVVLFNFVISIPLASADFSNDTWCRISNCRNSFGVTIDGIICERKIIGNSYENRDEYNFLVSAPNRCQSSPSPQPSPVPLPSPTPPPLPEKTSYPELQYYKDPNLRDLYKICRDTVGQGGGAYYEREAEKKAPYLAGQTHQACYDARADYFDYLNEIELGHPEEIYAGQRNYTGLAKNAYRDIRKCLEKGTAASDCYINIVNPLLLQAGSDLFVTEEIKQARDAAVRDFNLETPLPSPSLPPTPPLSIPKPAPPPSPAPTPKPSPVPAPTPAEKKLSQEPPLSPVSAPTKKPARLRFGVQLKKWLSAPFKWFWRQ